MKGDRGERRSKREEEVRENGEEERARKERSKNKE